jgi:hypothetical protein
VVSRGGGFCDAGLLGTDDWPVLEKVDTLVLGGDGPLEGEGGLGLGLPPERGEGELWVGEVVAGRRGEGELWVGEVVAGRRGEGGLKREMVLARDRGPRDVRIGLGDEEDLIWGSTTGGWGSGITGNIVAAEGRGRVRTGIGDGDVSGRGSGLSS